MSEELIGKADALMRRHRVFVAGGTRPTAEEDVPVLTEVVEDVAAGTPTSNPAEDELERRLNVRVEALRRLQEAAIADALDAWAEERLPALVAEALHGLAERVSGHLVAEARESLAARLRAALEQEPPAAG
ncbi:MAG TPA: hypothetical protein PK375_07360 [Rhodocyclaceae bacterium]|nr:hypothetical protein [Rhodocyclaceae bacterium]HNH35715.1 hypothetical protein [Rhodocyclaceae bacterium]